MHIVPASNWIGWHWGSVGVACLIALCAGGFKPSRHGARHVDWSQLRRGDVTAIWLIRPFWGVSTVQPGNRPVTLGSHRAPLRATPLRARVDVTCLKPIGWTSRLRVLIRWGKCINFRAAALATARSWAPGSQGDGLVPPSISLPGCRSIELADTAADCSAAGTAPRHRGCGRSSETEPGDRHCGLFSDQLVQETKGLGLAGKRNPASVNRTSTSP